MASTDDNTPGQPDSTSRAAAISAHAEKSISEDAIVAAARDRADDIGVGAISPAVGALLSLLAKLSGGKAVVEVGTGAGVSGLWLLSGMGKDGVLTTIDIEPEHQRIAKQAFAEAGVGPSRTRLISGRAQEVLTRLADESYDLVFIDADPIDQPNYIVEGVRLLRTGGVIVVHRAALGGRANDPAANDAEVTAVREAARMIAEDERLTPALVPLGDGLLAAVRD
ncbi:MAG: O-methyltransferase [Mycobacterium sp.]|nr:O-methyltransferase [Mycobacterium sp.]